MLFRILSRDRFRTLVETIMETTEVVAPKKVGVRSDGEPIHQFLPVADFDEMDLAHETTEHSAKTYFLPYRENLSTYAFSDDDWQQEVHYRIQPRAMVGLHACDINALLRLDKVFVRDHFPSPYYVSRRRNTLIIGIDHEPCEGGFCRSLGTDTVTRGFDLYLTDLGDRYFVAVGSDHGFELAAHIQLDWNTKFALDVLLERITLLGLEQFRAERFQQYVVLIIEYCHRPAMELKTCRRYPAIDIRLGCVD